VKRTGAHITTRSAATVLAIGALPLLMAQADGVVVGSLNTQVVFVVLLFLVCVSLGCTTFSVMHGKALEVVFLDYSSATSATTAQEKRPAGEPVSNSANNTSTRRRKVRYSYTHRYNVRTYVCMYVWMDGWMY
jgi:hypothetical protein